MPFVLNSASGQLLSLFDSYEDLTEREKKFFNKSWAKYFVEYIFPQIDEVPYAVLYSEKNSRLNAPVISRSGH